VTSTAVQVGTVEVLRWRIYQAPDGGDVAVGPGTYPILLEEDGTVRWLMRGRPSRRHSGTLEPLGDGMFLGRPAYDEPRGGEIDVPGKPFTRAEFRDFLTIDPVVRDGDPQQRLRVRMEAEL